MKNYFKEDYFTKQLKNEKICLIDGLRPVGPTELGTQCPFHSYNLRH